jgi:hypothetical protein
MNIRISLYYYNEGAMSLKRLVGATLCSLALGILTFGAMDHMFAKPPAATRPEPAVEISLRLDKDEVTPEQSVRLQELVPASFEAKVDGTGHSVLRIGKFDAKRAELVNMDSAEFSLIAPDKVFDKLPGMLAFFHPIDFEVRTPRHKGVEFELRANRLGIFLITARWYLRDREGTIASAPVVLVVKPPKDANGRPVVKPEWLVNDYEGKLEIKEGRQGRGQQGR